MSRSSPDCAFSLASASRSDAEGRAAEAAREPNVAFTAPEGGFASDAGDSAARVREFRAMVMALHQAGLRVGMDVVYNHTSASGQDPKSVLDRVGRGPERFLPGDEAANIRQPALLLWCKQDAVIDASALDLYAARIPQARKVLLDDCGHMSIMERPDAVADAVNALIEQDSPR